MDFASRPENENRENEIPSVGFPCIFQFVNVLFALK